MEARRRASAGDELQSIRDAVCLDAYNDLISVQVLSLIIGVSRWTVLRWIKRARDNPEPPDLEIWCNGSGKACIHGKPIVPGMPVICVDCIEMGNIDGCTGVPKHPAMRKVKYSEPIRVAGEEAAAKQPKGLPAKPKWTREGLREYIASLAEKKSKKPGKRGTKKP